MLIDGALKYFERIIVHLLILMMAVVILLATGQLGWLIVQDIVTPPLFVLEIGELLDIFGFFLLILIGIELLETIKAYLTEHILHVEIVLEVALIAIARKVIILDAKELPSLTLLGIAALIVALATAFSLEKHARRTERSARESDAASR